MGDRFELGGFLLERCGRQVGVGRVFVGEMWATGSSWEGFRWRDVSDRFELGGFSLERLRRHVPIGTVNMEYCDQCTARLRSCALQLFNTPTSEQNNTLT